MTKHPKISPILTRLFSQNVKFVSSLFTLSCTQKTGLYNPLKANIVGSTFLFLWRDKLNAPPSN